MASTHARLPLDTPVSIPDLTGRIFKLSDQIQAGGAYGDVYKCRYQSGAGAKEVAVKTFRFKFVLEHTNGDEVTKMIRRELGIWKRLNHHNIVPFLGTVIGFGRQGSTSLVSLWMDNGALSTFLVEHGDRLTVAHRLKLLSDTANGLSYLHSSRIVHGDLSSNNVLIDSNFNARLTDFGYASAIGEIPEALHYLQMSTKRPGTLRWAAPELLLEDTTDPTTKSDIYSFGSLGLLVLSGQQPWSETRKDHTVFLHVSRGEKPCRPKHQPIEDSHWEMIERCWLSIDQRPLAEDVVASIQCFLRAYPPSQNLLACLGIPSTSGTFRAPQPLGVMPIPKWSNEQGSAEHSPRIRVNEDTDIEALTEEDEDPQNGETSGSKRFRFSPWWLFKASKPASHTNRSLLGKFFRKASPLPKLRQMIQSRPISVREPLEGSGSGIFPKSAPDVIVAGEWSEERLPQDSDSEVRGEGHLEAQMGLDGPLTQSAIPMFDSHINEEQQPMPDGEAREGPQEAHAEDKEPQALQWSLERQPQKPRIISEQPQKKHSVDAWDVEEWFQGQQLRKKWWEVQHVQNAVSMLDSQELIDDQAASVWFQDQQPRKKWSEVQHVQNAVSMLDSQELIDDQVASVWFQDQQPRRKYIADSE